MAYYIRKISRAKWPKEEFVTGDLECVSADAITNCTKTTQNKLSLWRVDSPSNTVDDIVPLILGFEKLNNCDVIYISEQDLKDAGIKVEQSIEDANVCIDNLKKNHYNAEIIDYYGLGKFAQVVLKSLGSHRRYRDKEIKGKLNGMLANHEIESTMIASSLYEKLIG